MAKSNKPQKHHRKKEKPNELLTLQDTLNNEILLKLKQAQAELELEEDNQKLQEEERKKEERRKREKNKSFAELLNENPMDWKKFK